MSPSKDTSTSTALAELSSQLASAVESAGQSVVAIHARRRIPSSGVLWRDGVIVSASHTVKRDEDITVTLPSGTDVPARIAGRDSATDLIALRVEGATTRVASKAEPEAARVGALVLAIGRPGRSVTASFGIVSAVSNEWRTWQGTQVEKAMRLDLSIYDGFSGGPLVDASGRVLGLNNSAMARGTPMALGVGTVDRVLNELLERGHVRRAYAGIGVQAVSLSASIRQKHGLSQENALLVIAVEERAPADVGGVLVGDVLLTGDGRALRHMVDLFDVLSAVREGGMLTLTVLRGGEITKVSFTPGDRGAGR